MQAIVTNLPNWIQAGSAVAIVVLTFLTLLVLRDYAADTKKIAKASVTQVENKRNHSLPYSSNRQKLGDTEAVGLSRMRAQGQQ